MELRLIAGGDCGRDDCPTTFLTDRGTIAVLSSLVGKETPVGEAVVEVPVHILREAVRALGW